MVVPLAGGESGNDDYQRACGRRETSRQGTDSFGSLPFDIDFKLLPPKLQMQLWVLALDANTSKVNLAYRSGSFVTGLAYNYGGNVEASLGFRRVSTTVGVNPANGDV